MATGSLGCVPDSDDEGPSLRAPRHAAPIECEAIVSDGEEAAGPWRQQSFVRASTTVHAAPQARAEEPADGALRQLNAQLLLPPPSSQHYQGAPQPWGKGFRRQAATVAAKPAAAASASARRGARPCFRRSMKTAEAAQADRAVSEQGAADEAELAAALAAVGTAQAAQGGEGVPELQAPGVPSPAPHRQHQQQVTAGSLPVQRPASPPAAVPRPAVLAAVMPACGTAGPSFLNRRAIPPQPSQAGERRQQAQEEVAPSAQALLPTASSAATVRQGGVDAVDVHCSSAAAASGHLSGQQSGAAPSAERPAAAAAPRQAGPAQPQSGSQAASAAVASAPAAAAKPATFHRTADGLNVIFLNRQQPAAAAAAAGSKAAGRSGKGGADGVNSGWGNNFVKMDLKKGRGSTKYSTKHGGKRRKKAGRFSSRWQASRLRQVGDGADYLEGWQGSKLRCFKCGGTGHFAKECTAEQQAQADMGALLDSSDDDDDQPKGSSQGGPAAAPHPRGSFAAAAVPAAAALSQQGSGALRAMSSGSAPPPAPPAADPAEQFAAVLAEPGEEALTGVLRQVFGHPAFRGLQLPTVQRLLGGESLLSIMPTGMGKSLCYQLPALLMPGLTLVVSPLIALMHDQAASVPPPLTAAVLWSGQTRADALQVLSDVAAGRIKVLFVSPERLNNPHLLEALRPRMPLPLVVVDEAHCVAEWGHSFRPAYFRLGAALAGAVQAQRILALTATATRATEEAIRQVLRIPEGSVLRDAAVRHNLRLQVLRTSGGGSSQATRERICSLLAPSGPLGSVRSAIVYVAFKEDANQLARLLGVRGVSARAYHAGKDHRERAAVEADFAAGRARVVVATVAFGMGINLAGVGAVVHATMPRSLEEYVQQVGRAGRDGSEARCVALLDDSDFTRLRSLAFSGVLDLPAVRGFLAAVFSPAAEGERTRRRGANGKAKAADAGEPAAVGAAAGGTSRGRKRKGEAAEPVGAGGGRSSRRKGTAEASEAGPTDSLSEAAHEEAGAGAGAASAGSDGEAGGAAEAAPQPQRRRFGVLAVKKLADELDMREEGMETVLSYLEAEEAPCLRMLPTAALSVRVSFYAAAPEALAQQHPVVQHVLEACPHPRNGVYSAPAAKLAAAAQQAPGLVLQELRGLAAGGLIGFELSREEGPAYEILHNPPDLDALARQVHSRLQAVLACQVSRLDTSYRALAAAVAAGTAAGQAGKGGEAAAEALEATLRAAVQRYFEEEQGAGGSSPAAAVEREGGCAGAAPASGSTAAPAAGSRSACPLLLDTAGLPLRPTTPALLTAARAALRSNREQAGPALSGCALARILHGVGSPAFPSNAWQKRMGAFWGSQQLVDFGAVLRAAEIVVRSEAGGAAGGSGAGGTAGDDSE